MTINFRVYGYVYGYIRASTKIQATPVRDKDCINI
jgi:hypothetical protein